MSVRGGAGYNNKNPIPRISGKNDVYDLSGFLYEKNVKYGNLE